MESSTVHRVYRFRLEPTAEQEQRLRQFAGARRFIWNWALQQRREHHRRTGKSLPARELSAHLTALKDQPETAWLREMDSQLLQQVLADLQRAYVNFFERRARYPRFKSRKRDTARFRIPQRVHSRRQKGSRNKARARSKVARVHQRIANQRAHFCHDLTTKLIRKHQAVCIEGLNVKGLARTKLATSFYDAALGQIRRQLVYKGEWFGMHVVVVDRFFPSTQLCSVCGYKNTTLTLEDRAWTCPVCGTTHDRDLNAAVNIKKEGLRLLAVGHTESLNACGADV